MVGLADGGKRTRTYARSKSAREILRSSPPFTLLSFPLLFPLFRTLHHAFTCIVRPSFGPWAHFYANGTQRKGKESMRQVLIRRSHSVLGAGGRPPAAASRFRHMMRMPMQHKRPLAIRPLASFTSSFSSSSSSASPPPSAPSASSSSSKSPQLFQHISPEELSKLNRTSVGLYRLLLKECLRIGDERPSILLQEDVNTDEFGKIQPFMNGYKANAARSSNDIIQQEEDNDNNDKDEDEDKDSASEDDRAVWSIISFFLQNLQRTNNQNQSTSDVLAKLDDALFYADQSPSRRHYQMISATPAQLVHAVRTAFFRIHDSDGTSTELQSKITKADIIALHRRAIDAVSMLHAQKRLMDCTSVGENAERGVRVIAVSKYKSKGILSRGAGIERNEEHVFVYRITIEYLGVNGSGKGRPLQLLGRRWRITDGVKKDDDNYGDDDHEEPDVQVVDAPRTGVVGYHPILHVGDAFQYTSGCNLVNSVGTMEGSYVFCELEEDDIREEQQKLGRIGDELPAFKYEEDGEKEEGDDDGETTNEDRFFEVPVAPFLLDASK